MKESVKIYEEGISNTIPPERVWLELPAEIGSSATNSSFEHQTKNSKGCFYTTTLLTRPVPLVMPNQDPVQVPLKQPP